MKRLPSAFTCVTVDKSCPWFTVGKSYPALYKDDGAFIQDDEQNEVTWKLTRVSGVWSLDIKNHLPRIVATFKEQE